jgi:hypothetical protein
MRTNENRSLLIEGIKLGARIAAPFALTWLARNAIHFRGKPTPINPQNLPRTGIRSEDIIIDKLPALMEAYPSLYAYHEPIRVATSDAIPNSNHNSNATVPDFVFSLRPLETRDDIEGALVLESTTGRIDKKPKRRQQDVLTNQGIRALVVGPDRLKEIQSAQTGKQVASALFGAFWPTNPID